MKNTISFADYEHLSESKKSTYILVNDEEEMDDLIDHYKSLGWKLHKFYSNPTGSMDYLKTVNPHCRKDCFPFEVGYCNEPGWRSYCRRSRIQLSIYDVTLRRYYSLI